MLKTAGIVNSLCLVEIKTPDTPLLETTPYRSDCWAASRELSGLDEETYKEIINNYGVYHKMYIKEEAK